MDTLRTLEILITSRTPLIAIETLEEERAEQALERVAGRLRIPLFTWTMTRGLRRSGPVDSIYETKEPLKALRSVAEMNEGIYLMKDLYRSLNDAAVVRTIQDLAHPVGAPQADRRGLRQPRAPAQARAAAQRGDSRQGRGRAARADPVRGGAGRDPCRARRPHPRSSRPRGDRGDEAGAPLEGARARLRARAREPG